MIYDTFIGPFVEFEFMRRALVGACALASALILGAVDLVEPRIDWPLARVCSDAALLTPIVALVLT